MELTDVVKALLLNTAKDLKGSARRIFMARAVQALGERELAWKRGTIRKGMEELKHGLSAWMPSHRVAASAAKTICRTSSTISPPLWMCRVKADPQFRTSRLYTRLMATEVRRQLIVQRGYTDEKLPTAETIATKLNLPSLDSCT